MEFNELVRVARKTKRFTQTDLAKRAGISTAMICSLEQGTRQTTLETGSKILEALGFKVERIDTNLVRVVVNDQPTIFFFDRIDRNDKVEMEPRKIRLDRIEMRLDRIEKLLIKLTGE